MHFYQLGLYFACFILTYPKIKSDKIAVFIFIGNNKVLWYRIFSKAFESIINNNGVPSSIYGDFIAILIEKQLAGDFDLTQGERLPLGAKVAIMEGKYEDEIGYIEKFNGAKRADILISIMGRKIRETLSLVNLRPAW